MIKFVQFGGLGDMGQMGIGPDTGIDKTIDSPIGGQAETTGDKTIQYDYPQIEEFDDFSVSSNSSVGGGIIGDLDISDSPIQKANFSKESKPGSFNTLYGDFNFKAIPVYNFFVEDEEVNDKEGRGNRSLEDIPRYVKLTWRRAPVTDKPPIYDQKPPTDKRIKSLSYRNMKPIRSDVKRGLRFDHIDAETFSKAINSLANSFISMASISAVVEMPLVKAGLKDTSKTMKVDEQKYLKSEMTEGVSIHDIQANINIETYGPMKAAKIGGMTSKSLKDVQKDLYDGSFSLEKSFSSKTIKGTKFDAPAKMTMKSILPSSPGLSFDMSISDQVSQGGKSFGGQKEELLESFVYELVSKPVSSEKESEFTEVTFVDPAITGLVEEKKIDMISGPEHVESVIGLGQFMPNLKIMSDMKVELGDKKIIPWFPAVQEESGTEYVGYVIEKYVQNENGMFELVDVIEIPNVECTEYIDSRVVYGGVYRYRIRAILRWTRKGNVTHMGFEEGNFFDDDFTQTKTTATHKSSYFASEWNRNWKYAAIIDMVKPDPPDEFRVRPESHRKRIIVTWKLPHNPQNDIYYYRLFRKLRSSDKGDISDWELIHVSFGANNVMFIDNDVEFHQKNGLKYVYAAQIVTRHGEYSLLSCQLAAKLNESYRYVGEFPIEQISEEGVRLEAIGAFSIKPMPKIFGEIVAKNSMLLKLREGSHDKPFMDVTYIIRVESLDSGQKKDMRLDVAYTEVEPITTIHKDIVVIRPDALPLVKDMPDKDISIGISLDGAVDDSTADTGREKDLYIKSTEFSL